MLLWIDLETTGIEPADNHILEVAWQLTNHDLTPVSDMYTYVVEPDPVIWSLLPQVPEVYVMHENSGLLEDLENSRGAKSLWEIEDMIIHHIFCNPDDIVMVAGFSVHFDLGFIREHMPRLARKLSHRVFDVSTLKTFFKTFDVVPMYENVSKHRAYWDTIEAMNVTRDFRQFVSTHTKEETNA